jgi:integrase/recombinase XerC
MNCLPDVNWDGYLRGFSPELVDAIRGYVIYRSRSWREENRLHNTRNLLSEFSVFLRSVQLACVQGVTPRVWFAHVEARLKAGVQPSSLNTTLWNIQSFLRHAKYEGIPICETMLKVRPLKTGEALPRDLTVNRVRSLLQVVTTPMDRAWILLMLHSGLRTCEVRSLRWRDVDLQARILRIHKSKGLQSRVVFLSSQVVQAMNDLPRNSEFVFTHKNKPLDRKYCLYRLEKLGKQCGIHVTPHQLRHTCAAMLLNAGMSILGVQRILGHKYVETTLRYARVYDSTVARDFLEASAYEVKKER